MEKGFGKIDQKGKGKKKTKNVRNKRGHNYRCQRKQKEKRILLTTSGQNFSNLDKMGEFF